MYEMDQALIYSAENCDHVALLPRLQKGKLLRAWTQFLDDPSLVIKRTDRYGDPQLAVWTQRPVTNILTALSFVIAALHPSVRSEKTTAVGLRDISVFEEYRKEDGKAVRRLFLGMGPGRLVNVSSKGVLCMDTQDLLKPQHACYPLSNVHWLARSSWLGLLTYSTCMATMPGQQIPAYTELTAFYGSDYCELDTIALRVDNSR